MFTFDRASLCTHAREKRVCALFERNINDLIL